LIEDPRALTKLAPTPRMQMLVELTIQIAEAPWRLTRDHMTRAMAAGLSEEDILHCVLIDALFGHLNRIADATGVALDYDVKLKPPAIDHAVPPWPAAPKQMTNRSAIDLARRPTTAAALTEWRNYVFHRDAPITRRQRTLIARWVASWLGDGGISAPADLTTNPLDDALRTVAEVVTLAPWRLSDATYAPLRAAGFDDAAIFDVCVTASTAGVFSRIEVALGALGQPAP
jgi:alkylhydroperoxidase family enzyme